jgi:glycosyltransferase involved in cell wall biosynthesis
MPSKFESFGLVALEAMARGCVPVVADQTALPEVVGDAGIVFRNGSLDDLISKLQFLMSNDHELERRSDACKSRVMKEFSQRAIMKMNLDFFQSAIIAANRKHAP